MAQILLAITAVGIMACAHGAPPTQALAEVRGALRACEVLTATHVPAAALHMQLARQGLDQALHSMQNNDNHNAAYALMRAQADAELALALAREAGARAAAHRVVDHVQSSDQQPAF